MSVEELKGDEYTIEYNDGTQTIRFKGTIRLQTTDDYAPAVALLLKMHEAAAPGATVYLDFRELQFLNSSGINTVSKFVITARNANKVVLKVLGNRDIYWQQKSLTNLQKLWPKVQIEIL